MELWDGRVEAELWEELWDGRSRAKAMGLELTWGWSCGIEGGVELWGGAMGLEGAGLSNSRGSRWG